MKDILNKIFKTISGFIFAILVLIIIAIVFYVVRINYLAAHDRLGEIRTNFYTILTQSMYPTIKAGDIVVTYRKDENKYEKEDVITFISEANGSINITHRIKDIYNDGGNLSYQTKGDNNSTVDNEIIKSSNVLGKVVFKIPKAGFIQQFLVSRTGWIIAIVLPSLGIIIYDVLKLIKKAYGKKDLIDDEDEKIKKRKKDLEQIMNLDEQSENSFEISPAPPIDPRFNSEPLKDEEEEIELL